jgi:predicted PurR-regulated permease PerM
LEYAIATSILLDNEVTTYNINTMAKKIAENNIYDTLIRMIFLLLIVAWCLLMLFPFVNIMLWGLILGIALMPIHTAITKRLNGKVRLASAILVIICLAIIIIPSVIFLNSIIDSVKELRASYQAGTLSIPPPPEKVKGWPLIGENIYGLWQAVSSDLKEFIISHKEKLAEIGKKLASGLLGVTGGMFQMIGAIIIAGILLAVSGTGEAIRKFFRKVAGNRGDEFADVVKLTVGNVVKGILGVAMIQAFLIGIGIVLAGIPLAGLWTIVVLIFAILQLPPIIVILPVIIYMFSTKEPVPAALWTVYLLLAGLSDNILKPILLGKGAPVPMLVIFLGVIGGFIVSGFIGLFSGAIVMSIGYKLFVAWINSADQEEVDKLEE